MTIITLKNVRYDFLLHLQNRQQFSYPISEKYLEKESYTLCTSVKGLQFILSINISHLNVTDMVHVHHLLLCPESETHYSGRPLLGRERRGCPAMQPLGSVSLAGEESLTFVTDPIVQPVEEIAESSRQYERQEEKREDDHTEKKYFNCKDHMRMSRLVLHCKHACLLCDCNKEQTQQTRDTKE